MSDTTAHINLEVRAPGANAAGLTDLMTDPVIPTSQEPGLSLSEWSEVEGFAESYRARFVELVDSCFGIISNNAAPFIKSVQNAVLLSYISQKGGIKRL